MNKYHRILKPRNKNRRSLRQDAYATRREIPRETKIQKQSLRRKNQNKIKRIERTKTNNKEWQIHYRTQQVSLDAEAGMGLRIELGVLPRRLLTGTYLVGPYCFSRAPTARLGTNNRVDFGFDHPYDPRNTVGTCRRRILLFFMKTRAFR